MIRSSFVAILIVLSQAITGSFLFARSLPQAMVQEGAACPATITQSTSQNVLGGNSVLCSNGMPPFNQFNTSYWRAFDMAALTNSQAYNITSVSFGVESATSGSGTQPITV